MKVHVTEAKIVVGKDKREWLKVSFIKPNGETGSGILPSNVCAIPKINITTEELLNFTQTEVEFDDRGRLVNVG